MKNQNKRPLILCLFALIILGCQKEDSGDNADPFAVFNLAASDSACIAMTLNGNFLQGKQVTTNENLQIQVVISKPGKWSFSSDTLNGFSFSGNGNFTDTGKHLITLAASGIPASTGNYVFSMTKGSVKRSVSIAVVKSNVVIESVPLKSYFKGTIGGVEYYVEVPTVGPNDIPYGQGGGDTASFSSFVGPGIFPNPPGTGTISLQKGFLYHYNSSTEADFKNFFKPGAYPFSAKKCAGIFPGVILAWTDSNNEPWVTLKDMADQAGSSFTITGIEDGHDNKGHYFVKVISKFNCRLYNFRSSETKELKNGELVSFFIK